MIDLHLHTTASDGRLTPKQLVEAAKKRGLKAIAITDHDTVDGVQEALDNAEGIEVIPGIEISCYEKGYPEVHILGYFIDHNDPKLLAFTKKLRQERLDQKKAMIIELNKMGYDITYEEVLKKVGTSFGRPHIAQALVEKYPKKFRDIRDVFKQVLFTGGPAYVEREESTSMSEAIAQVKAAGGIPILAHPGAYPKFNALKLIRWFKREGGMGIETYYPYYYKFPRLALSRVLNKGLVRYFRSIAKKEKLLETGGSDYHDGDMLDLKIPDSVLEKLKVRLSCR
ncbi:MAG: PHP domain-containing protein [Nanoarchaeota archaeon]|nr:PHP domain-containing protein [Nanoarchaeota archaeon]